MKVAPLVRLSTEDRRRLKDIVSKGTSPARVHTRARILLLAAERSFGNHGFDRRKTNSNLVIGQILGISPRTVSHTRQKFVQGGLEAALFEHHRSGRPVEIDGEAEAHLVALACSDPPEGRKRWTLQLLADRMVELHYTTHISDTWVLAKLKKTNCIPGRSKVGASPR